MTLLLVVLAFAPLAITLTLLHHMGKRDAAWADERRELLTRIQRPEIVPVKPASGYVIPDREPDEYGQVGAIEFDPAYGTD